MHLGWHTALELRGRWRPHPCRTISLTQVDRLVICVFLEKDEGIYRARLPHYFPVGMCPCFPPGHPTPPPMPRGVSHCPLPSSLRLPQPTLNRTGKQGLAHMVWPLYTTNLAL